MSSNLNSENNSASCKASVKTERTISNSLGKKERIKSNKEIELIFTTGEVIFSSNRKLKAIFLLEKNVEEAVIKAAFTVSKKAGNAAWRNRVKRLLREAYRTNKIIFNSVLNSKIKLLVVFSSNYINQKNNKKLFLKDITPAIIELMNQIKDKV